MGGLERVNGRFFAAGIHCHGYLCIRNHCPHGETQTFRRDLQRDPVCGDHGAGRLISFHFQIIQLDRTRAGEIQSGQHCIRRDPGGCLKLHFAIPFHPQSDRPLEDADFNLCPTPVRQVIVLVFAQGGNIRMSRFAVVTGKTGTLCPVDHRCERSRFPFALAIGTFFKKVQIRRKLPFVITKVHQERVFEVAGLKIRRDRNGLFQCLSIGLFRIQGQHFQTAGMFRDMGAIGEVLHMITVMIKGFVKNGRPLQCSTCRSEQRECQQRFLPFQLRMHKTCSFLLFCKNIAQFYV